MYGRVSDTAPSRGPLLVASIRPTDHLSRPPLGQRRLLPPRVFPRRTSGRGRKCPCTRAARRMCWGKGGSEALRALSFLAQCGNGSHHWRRMGTRVWCAAANRPVRCGPDRPPRPSPSFRPPFPTRRLRLYLFGGPPTGHRRWPPSVAAEKKKGPTSLELVSGGRRRLAALLPPRRRGDASSRCTCGI